MKYTASILFAILAAGSLKAQDKTTTQRTPVREIARAHKVMLIPYEPRMYMGEVDRQIHEATSLTAEQIRGSFRDGLNEQLYRAFKDIEFNVVDLMEDSVKYRQDIHTIYRHLGYKYLNVPDQANYKPPVEQEREKTVEKGQLVVATNTDKRFMNAQLDNPRVMPQLYSKYKTDIFVFINQLDIRASGSPDPTQLMNSSGNRKISVHYTVFTNKGKEINSGLAEEEFDPALNHPRKIIEKHFSKIAATIATRVNRQLALQTQ